MYPVRTGRGLTSRCSGRSRRREIGLASTNRSCGARAAERQGVGQSIVKSMRERVYGTVDYYGGVLGGVADFRGILHAFELHDETDASCPIYRLIPLAAEEVEAAIGGVHPAVPVDSLLRARGRFLPRDEALRGEDGEWALEVEWLDERSGAVAVQQAVAADDPAAEKSE